MKPAVTGMVLDRALTPTLLDVALRVATQAGPAPDARKLLTVALRDHVSAQEAQGKVRPRNASAESGFALHDPLTR